MEKIVVTSNEVAETIVSDAQPNRLEPKLPPAIAPWARVAMSPLVLVLPLLCLVTLVLRFAMRGLPPRIRFAWLAFLSSLLMVSGILTTVAGVLVFSLDPQPLMVSSGLSELDAKADYPALPAAAPLSAKQVSEELKPLVAVISPARKSLFTHYEVPSSGFGAGVLLHAGPEGYLFMTARHVIESSLGGRGDRALIAMPSGTWTGAEVIARHQVLDLALLWMPRRSGSGRFKQPIRKERDVSEGENIFVIGHPEGLRYTLSTGIISRIDKDAIQISAPVSPGNSGGPVFDDRGNLVAIVTSMVDRGSNPNAENLNFAVRAEAALQTSAWNFLGHGLERLNAFLNP